MKNYIIELIKDFNGKNFKDFLRYFNYVLEKEIESQKSDLLKNKYIKIRKTGLQYILAHQKEIQVSINNK